MVNWYCLIHFPDGTEKVHLVPGPAPIADNAIVTIANVPGRWLVRDMTTRVPHDTYAAELWVEQSAWEKAKETAGERKEKVSDKVDEMVQRDSDQDDRR